MHAPISRTAVLIEKAKQASVRSYVARFKAMNIAGWAVLLRHDAANLRQAPAAEGKKLQEKA